MTNLNATQRAKKLRENYPQMFPVDPFRIAQDLKIEIRYLQNPRPDVAGTLSRESADTPLIIAINPNDPFSRQRFTVAHELGHYTKLQEEDKLNSRLGFVEMRDELASTGRNPVENDANEFAAELLMPEKWIRHWHEIGIGFQAIRNALNVSTAALETRYRFLGLSR